jgi:hypothetical protein
MVSLLYGGDVKFSNGRFGFQKTFGFDSGSSDSLLFCADTFLDGTIGLVIL